MTEAERAERFWSRVDKAGPIVSGDLHCWLWQGARSKISGYGMITYTGPDGRKTTTAHRYAWRLIHGKQAPEGLDVMHSCDVRHCVAPHHLSVGTRKRNINDCLERGRMTQVVKKGSRGRNRKLTDEQRDQIRREYSPRQVTLVMLGERYGVNRLTILRVLKGIDISSADPDAYGEP